MQNKLERTIYAKNNNVDAKQIRRIPTKELLEANNTLSMHQLGAKAILNVMRKIIQTEKPVQLFNKLMRRSTREGVMWRVYGTPRLSISGSNLIEKGVRLWNQLTQDIKDIQSTPRFKKACKNWVKENIPIKPG